MAANEVAIVNLALSRLRSASRLTSAATVAALTEGTLAAQQAQLWYVPCRQLVIREFAWQFALRFSTLVLVEEFDETDEEFGRWSFSYRYPTGALLLRAIRSPGEDRKTTPPNEWELSSDATGGLIFTNVPDAYAEYMIDVTVTTLYPVTFDSALAWRLALELCNTLPGGDDKVRAACVTGYVTELRAAEERDSNEQEQGKEPDSEFVRARGGSWYGGGGPWGNSWISPFS